MPKTCFYCNGQGHVESFPCFCEDGKLSSKKFASFPHISKKYKHLCKPGGGLSPSSKVSVPSMQSMIPSLTQDLAKYLRGEWDDLDESPDTPNITTVCMNNDKSIDMSGDLGDVTYLSMASNE